MTTDATAPSPSTIWSEVAAERAGEPAKPVEKPVDVSAADLANSNAEAATRPDPLEAITAKLNDFENKIAGRLRNVEGHIGNLNGAQKELKTLLDASRAASEKVSHAPTQAQVRHAATSPAEWEDLKNDYPEWAIGVEKFFDARIGAARNIDGFDPKVFEAALKTELKGATEAVRKEIIDSSLEAVFPDWKETAKSEAFHRWASGQPPAIKALAQSDKVGDAARMLKLFETHKQANPARQLTNQRKQVLANATGAPRASAPPKIQKSWEDMNTQERWQAEAARRARATR